MSTGQHQDPFSIILQVWIGAGLKDLNACLQILQVGAHFEAPDEIIIVAPLDSWYTQVGFNLICFQVWLLLFCASSQQDSPINSIFANCSALDMGPYVSPWLVALS